MPTRFCPPDGVDVVVRDPGESNPFKTRDNVQGSWRTHLIVVLVFGAWMVLGGRLIQLQWRQKDELAGLANRQQLHEEVVPARPGDIVDRHGRLMATTITCRSLFVDPSALDDPRETAAILGRALRMSPDELFARLTSHRDRRFLWIKRRLSDAQVSKVGELNLPDGAWGFREEFVRRYPQGSLAAHVVGLRDIDGVGRGGVEQHFDRYLQGSPGRRVLVKDALGHVIEVRETPDESPQPGPTLVLTIDSVIQLYAEQEVDRLVNEFKPQSASAIVLDVNSGDVLAMASRPTFDPNDPEDVAPGAWKNAAVEAAYEPGSTFKPFVVAWALDRGRLQTWETFFCENGVYRMGRRLLHDSHPYGTLDVAGILVKSSNIGMAKIGERLTNTGLYEAAVTFGFGRRTGIELPGELAGTLRPLADWTPYSTGSIPMGQEIAVTPLQLISAYEALANGGTCISPHVVLGRGGDAPAVSAHVVSKIVAPPVAEWMVATVLRDVVLQGTGHRASLDHYTVFGKTGTAEKRHRSSGDGSPLRHTCWFVCGAPSENPRILVLVVADEPIGGTSQYGGTVAAPGASRLLQKSLVHLGVPSVASSREPPRMH